MKKFIALVVLLCTVMISFPASAEIKIVPLCEQDVPTLTQKLQEIPGVKIWGIKKFSGCYIGYFGNDDKNRLDFLLENDDSIKALFIESKFGNEDPIFEQMWKLAGGTLVIAGVTLEDVANLIQDIGSDMQKALSKDSRLKEYKKSFSVYRAQNNEKIVVNFSAKELTSNFGEFKIIIFAHE
ncbi:MAG: hypothetical protein SR1Q5_09090 [Quinella sp. 1Q5]|nr:hypothetical protein [Quinella sp. 1Q5]